MEELSRKIENPESKALSNEARQPEAVKPSEKDKEKLVPKENESSKRNQENRDTREGDEPAHPKLEPKDANELKNNEDDELRQPEGGEPGTPEGNGKKLEVNGSGQPEGLGPKASEGDEPKKTEGKEPGQPERIEPKNPEGDDIKKTEGKESGQPEGIGPKAPEGDNIKKTDGKESGQPEGIGPKVPEGDETKKTEGKEPGQPERVEPKEPEEDDIKKNEGKEPEKAENHEPENSEGKEPPKENLKPEQDPEDDRNESNRFGENRPVNPETDNEVGRNAMMRNPDGIVHGDGDNNLKEVPKIQDISDWIKDVNPNFDPDDWDSPYCNNCGSCALAVEKRLNGDNPDAVASDKNIGTISGMNDATGMEQKPMTPDEIRDYLVAQGPGSHGVVGVDRSVGPGHWFNAYYDGDQVYAIDGQSGEIRGWPPDYGNVSNWDFSVKKG